MIAIVEAGDAAPHSPLPVRRTYCIEQRADFGALDEEEHLEAAARGRDLGVGWRRDEDCGSPIGERALFVDTTVEVEAGKILVVTEITERDHDAATQTVDDLPGAGFGFPKRYPRCRVVNFGALTPGRMRDLCRLARWTQLVAPGGPPRLVG